MTYAMVSHSFSFARLHAICIQILTIPPPQNAITQKPKKSKPLPKHLIQRNEAVEYIQQHGSKQWKEQQDYHQRSLNEAVMFRYKTIFDGELDA